MAQILLTEASAGCPGLTGANGSLCALLDWALVQNGWAIEYTATNARIYRAGSGHRHRLQVIHDSAVTGQAAHAMVRGCEGATSTTSVTDSFPTVAQVTNANAIWPINEVTTPAGAARAFFLILEETYFILALRKAAAGTVTSWDLEFFGDMPPENPEDDWTTACSVYMTGSVGNNGGVFNANPSPPIPTTPTVFFVRDITGAVKSTRAGPFASGSLFGAISGTAGMRAGYGNRIEREKVALSCTGSSTATGATALVKRAWVPNVWNPLHSSAGGLTDADVFQDTAYDPSSSFRILRNNASSTLILEVSDTWSQPSG